MRGEGVGGLQLSLTPPQLAPEVLKEVALLLYTMAVTHVSVERMFSAVKVHKTDLRSRLKNDIPQSIQCSSSRSISDCDSFSQ